MPDHCPFCGKPCSEAQDCTLNGDGTCDHHEPDEAPGAMTKEEADHELAIGSYNHAEDDP